MSKDAKHDIRLDAVRGDERALAQVKFSADSLRTVRAGLIHLAYALEEYPEARAFLVLIDSGVTEARLREEWRRSALVLRPEVLARISICLLTPDRRFRGIPQDPPDDLAGWLGGVVDRELARPPARVERIDYEFVVLKLLILQWLTQREPVTMAWLTRTAGCSYPTVARVLKGLGSLLERASDRRIALRYFPREHFERLLAQSPRARSTVRWVDRSGQPRSPEAHVQRLRGMNPRGVAIGGVLGAKHYVPGLDLIGAPRLDLSIRRDERHVIPALVKQLDPALAIENDPLNPANVVLHVVPHADSLFAPSGDGLPWADPLECLLDLHEAHLERQASQFLAELERGRKIWT